jgi:predicted DNA-binding transcriptional regulator YafY
MPIDTPDQPNGIFYRLQAILIALANGPLRRPALLAQLTEIYPQADSARRMLDRDIRNLAALGIAIERSRSRPPLYTLHGGTPAFDEADLRALALVQATFGAGHPQANDVQRLVAMLTRNLNAEQRQRFERPLALRTPLVPAIDYSRFSGLIGQLEQAITSNQHLRFWYRNSSGGETLHRRIEPDAIEYHDRHFYLVAYSHNSGQSHDFRIDRIMQLEALERRPPGESRVRSLVPFRYRLAATLARGELSQRFEEQRIVEHLANGDVIIEAWGRSDFFIIQTLLRYRHLAELIDPPWLRAQMIATVQQLVEVYE